MKVLKIYYLKVPGPSYPSEYFVCFSISIEPNQLYNSFVEILVSALPKSGCPSRSSAIILASSKSLKCNRYGRSLQSVYWSITPTQKMSFIFALRKRPNVIPFSFRNIYFNVGLGDYTIIAQYNFSAD